MADTEVIKVTSGELILPKPRNKGAEIALTRMPSVLAQLPSGIERGAWAAAAMAEANSVDATPQSIAICVFNLAFLGLFPGKTLGHAHFVPFKGNAQLIVGYKGWIHLAYETRFLKDLHTDVICRDEPFKMWTDENGQHILHEPMIDREPDRVNIIGAYCIYNTRDGGRGMRVIGRKDIDKSDKKRDVWNSDFESMVRKTPILRSAKLWNTTSRLSRAIELDEMYDREEEQNLPLGCDVDIEAVPAASYKLPVNDE